MSNHSADHVYEYRIGGVQNCKNVFPYFDNYTLYSKKSLSYTLWKQIHEDLLNKRHLDPIKRVEMIEKTSSPYPLRSRGGGSGGTLFLRRGGFPWHRGRIINKIF